MKNNNIIFSNFYIIYTLLIIAKKMLNIINIQFGRNKNTDIRLKKVSNQGNIVPSRPQTAKHPYKIISIKEFPKKNFEIEKYSKNKFIQRGTNLDILNNMNKMKKNISFIEENKSNRNNIKYKHIFDHSSFINNKDLLLNYKYNNVYDRKVKVFSKSQKKKDNLLKNRINGFDFKKNKLFVNKRANTSYKKKVSSFSMNKYIENYIEKDKINELKHNNKSLNTFENSFLYKDEDYNIQVMKFLSEIVNKETLKRSNTSDNNNYNIRKNFHTTNNIKNNNGNTTRNLMIKRYSNNYPNNMTLSFSKNKNVELKPYVVNIKEKFGLSDSANSNSNYNFRKNYEYYNHYPKKQSARVSPSKGPIGNTIPKYRPLSAKINYSIKDRNIMNISVDKDKDKKVDKNNNRKYRIKIRTKSKKKKKYKIKGKTYRIFRSHENKSIHKKYNRVFECEKNSDIFDYLILPKDSEKKANEKENNKLIEFAHVNH